MSDVTNVVKLSSLAQTDKVDAAGRFLYLGNDGVAYIVPPENILIENENGAGGTVYKITVSNAEKLGNKAASEYATEAELTGGTVKPKLAGTADSANTLTNARSIKISDNTGANNGSAVSFNGSADITLKLPGTIAASITGNAASATKATQDGSGNTITSTYATKSELSTAEAAAKNLANATGTLTIAKGGTGATDARSGFMSLANGLIQGLTPEEEEYMIFKANNSNWGLYTFLQFWEYIKGKISSALGLTKDSYSGNAASATKATQDGSGNTITSTYQTKANANVTAELKGTTLELTIH